MSDIDYKQLVESLEHDEKKRVEDDHMQAKLEQEIKRRVAEKKKVPYKKNQGQSTGLILDDNSSDEQPLSAQKP